MKTEAETKSKKKRKARRTPKLHADYVRNWRRTRQADPLDFDSYSDTVHPFSSEAFEE